MLLCPKNYSLTQILRLTKLLCNFASQSRLSNSRGEAGNTPIGAIQSQQQLSQKGKTWQRRPNPQPQLWNKICFRFGRTPSRDRPAKDAICRKCLKYCHYQAMCRTAVRVGGIQTQEDDIFLGAVETQDGKTWSVSPLLNETPVNFHIDTGVEVIVISEAVRLGNPHCKPQNAH